jgi:16S rRNA (guanine(527)-N(7))-methyltransferase RsmG
VKRAAPCAQDSATNDRLWAFAELLLRWNRRINLVGRADEPFLWERHICDSMELAPFLPEAGAVVDLGSGAGFPGLVLAIATGRLVHLIEADQRKCAFLRAAARVTAANVIIHPMRAAAVTLPPAAAVTARGFAPLPSLLPVATRFLAPAGALVLLKGRSAEEELTAARSEWHMRIEQFPSRAGLRSVILRVSEIRRAAAA